MLIVSGYDPTKPNWNPIPDLNKDSKTDQKDLSILATNYGWKWK